MSVSSAEDDYTPSPKRSYYQVNDSTKFVVTVTTAILFILLYACQDEDDATGMGVCVCVCLLAAVCLTEPVRDLPVVLF